MSDNFHPNEIRGSYDASGMRFGLVVSRFNSFITERLLAGAMDALEKGGASAEQTDLVRVPGSFEIPLAAKKMVLARHYDAIIAIGVILKGKTDHAENLSRSVTDALQRIAITHGIPVVNVVLSFDGEDQARARCLEHEINRGTEAARAAVEIANVISKLRNK